MPTSPALHAALDLVGDRWSLLVIDALLDGPHRFADLQEAVGGIATNILTQRLRTLEERGLVVSRRYSDKPVRFTYELAGSARELGAALHLLASWGARQGGEDTAGHDRAHCPTCGGPVTYRPWCGTCDRPVDDDPSDPVRWA